MIPIAGQRGEVLEEGMSSIQHLVPILPTSARVGSLVITHLNITIVNGQ